MCSLNASLEEMMGEAKMSEDKAQRTMMDAARLADELRAEQEAAMALERDKKLLEAQAKDAQARVDEAETSALKGRNTHSNKKLSIFGSVRSSSVAMSVCHGHKSALNLLLSLSFLSDLS